MKGSVNGKLLRGETSRVGENSTKLTAGFLLKIGQDGQILRMGDEEFDLISKVT